MLQLQRQSYKNIKNYPKQQMGTSRCKACEDCDECVPAMLVVISNFLLCPAFFVMQDILSCG